MHGRYPVQPRAANYKRKRRHKSIEEKPTWIEEKKTSVAVERTGERKMRPARQLNSLGFSYGSNKIANLCGQNKVR
jgi:hypothetical protein